MTFHLLRPASLEKPGILIVSAKADTPYLFQPFPCDLGTAYWIQKPHGPRYEVLLPTRGQPLCDCWGFLRWNHCRHVRALRWLDSAKPETVSGLEV